MRWGRIKAATESARTLLIRRLTPESAEAEMDDTAPDERRLDRAGRRT